MTESNLIEYKRELSDGLEREIVAFLNYHDGGIVYSGIDKHGQTLGVREPDALQQDSDTGIQGLGMFEYLGSGMPRILKAYPREAFTFASQFIRLSMPHAEPISGEAGPESGLESIQARVLQALSDQPLSKSELAKAIGQKSISGKLNARVRALLEEGSNIPSLINPITVCNSTA